MDPIRVIALTTETAERVLATMKSPGYGHPAYTDVASGYGPCRHCLKPFRVGEERRTLFTYDPFFNLASIPLPGPVYIHAELCERFDEEKGYPLSLVPHSVVLDGYDREQRIVVRHTVLDGTQAAAIDRILSDEAVRYVMVRDLGAGCFDFRVERRAEVG